ncbi:MAG: hybrid sensor histidine kinase/response regulator [Chlorobi bacterium]|nr:hybrid sensor histidine kinase/response regulator [Chlorobiota bacterium]
MKAHRVLIIEDNAIICRQLQEILEFEGFIASIAMNGKKGIELAKSTIPNCIICDIMMPEINGYQVFDKLKNIEKTKNIPFIFITAKTLQEDIRNGMNRGADDYITKPFTAKQIIYSVKTRISKKEKQQEQYFKDINSFQKNISHAIPHELLTPLNSILNYAMLIQNMEKRISQEKIKSYGSSIYESGKRLYDTIRKYILYTKLESQFLLFTKNQNLKQSITINPEKIISRIGKNIATRYKRHDDFTCQIINNDINILQEHLEIVMAELIENAFKFSVKGNAINIYSKRNDKKTTIIIENYGKGISQENINKIMAFKQFDREISEQQGLGLGLIIAKTIVEFYGNFSIESTENKVVKIILNFETTNLKS